MSLLTKCNPKEVREKDDLMAWKEQQEADLAYLFMMSDVDLPEDEETAITESEE